MTIAEVGKLYHLTADTLRYYERAGLIPPVNRKGGIRNYTEEDCRWVEFIKCMRGAGMAIHVLAEYVQLVGQGEETSERRKNILKEQRAVLQGKMEEMAQTLQRLTIKIEKYEQTLGKAEEKLVEEKH